MVTIEPLLQEQVDHLLPAIHMNISTYLRSLIIKDLNDRGLLPETIKMALLTGEQGW